MVFKFWSPSSKVAGPCLLQFSDGARVLSPEENGIRPSVTGAERVSGYGTCIRRQQENIFFFSVRMFRQKAV
jgi:hypothetical protein